MGIALRAGRPRTQGEEMNVAKFESFSAEVGGRKREGLRNFGQAKKFLLPWFFTPAGTLREDAERKPLTGTITAAHEEFDLDDPREAEVVVKRNLRRVREAKEVVVPHSDAKLAAAGCFTKQMGPGEKLMTAKRFRGALVDGVRVLVEAE